MTNPDTCEWCGRPLAQQRWISLWTEPKGEIHCCTEECLTFALSVSRAIQFDVPAAVEEREK